MCVCVFQEGKDPTQLELQTGNVVCFSCVPLFTLGIRGPGRLASEREVEFFASVKLRSGYVDQQSKLVLIKASSDRRFRQFNLPQCDFSGSKENLLKSKLEKNHLFTF